MYQNYNQQHYNRQYRPHSGRLRKRKRRGCIIGCATSFFCVFLLVGLFLLYYAVPVGAGGYRIDFDRNLGGLLCSQFRGLNPADSPDGGRIIHFMSGGQNYTFTRTFDNGRNGVAVARGGTPIGEFASSSGDPIPIFRLRTVFGGEFYADENFTFMRPIGLIGFIL